MRSTGNASPWMVARIPPTCYMSAELTGAVIGGPHWIHS